MTRRPRAGRGNRQRFILPQRKQANVVISLRSASDEPLTDPSREPEKMLEIEASNSFHLEPLVEELRQLETLEIRHEPYRDSIHQSLSVRGDVSKARLDTIATAILPNLYELSQTPRFRAGLDGVLQLLTLVCPDEVLRWRQ